MIVITGATGFVGSHIMERWTGRYDLLLVSRDPAKAERRFPGTRCCHYDDLRDQDLTGATVIHLAVRNNDRPGAWEEYRSVNVELLADVAAMARASGAARFINLCSTRALRPNRDDLYGLSKQEGGRRLKELFPRGGINLYVPAIYGGEFRGRLALLNRVPTPLRPPIVGMLRLVAPMLSVDNLVSALRDIVAAPPDTDDDPWRQERHAADPVAHTGLYVAAKRTIDLAAAVTLAILAGWAMLLIALYIRIDSRGPAVFAQQRVGRDGRLFTCYKFRTMAMGTAHVATHHAAATSVTKAGRFLRRTKLDELPQIVNVFRNQMSLVGPRPCLPLQEELIARREARGVLAMKPGITGLSQINDVDMSEPERLAAWDDRYRAFRTLAGDLVILLRTVVGGGSGDRTVPPASLN